MRGHWLLGAALWGVLATIPAPAAAHPMGNFSINHYAGIRVEPEIVELLYLIDLAEIPTFQEIQATGIIPEEGHPGLARYRAQKAAALKEGLSLEVNSRRLSLTPTSSQIIFPPGAGGLPTMKLGIRYRAKLDGAPALNHLRYRDDNFPDRAGWKEVVAVVGQGVTVVSSSVPDKDRSLQLTDYPTDLLNSPPQDLEARLVFTRERQNQAVATLRSQDPPPARPERAPERPLAPVRLEANRQVTPRNSFTELMTANELSLGIVFIAAAVALGLGAFHALEPGHGKTVVAAYLVGSRGTAWHALILGLTVTLSHTAGVYLLGAVTLYASQYVVPERLYPWLGVISGLTIAGLGFFLFLKRYSGEAHPHSHGPDEDPGHGHGAHHHHHHETGGGRVSLREIIALGVTGGIVPCPAALVVLLSALALRRVGFGLFLIVAFSVGLAAVLIAIGLLMVYARRFMSRFQGDGRLITRWLPLTSSAVITLLGVGIAVQALVTAGVLQIRL